MNWIVENRQWIFSGIGVFLLGGIITLFKFRWRGIGRGENHPDIAIHTQSVRLSARAFHEEYDNALGIFISNTGSSPIHIRRALFRNRVSVGVFLQKASNLPVYPKAFKDVEQDAYELKFGEQWYDPQTTIQPWNRVMTYLPLSEEVRDTDCNKGRHGVVLLRYFADGKAGTHRVRV